VLDLTPKNFKDVKEATKWLEKFLDDRGIDNWSGKIERGVQGSGNYQRAQISNTSANLGMFGRNEGIEEGDQDFVWLEGDFNGDVKVNSTSQGSWRDRETRQVELIRGKMSNVRPVAGPPPDTGNVVKQAKIPLIIDAGHQKFNATGVDLQLNVDPNSYVIQGNYGLVAGTAVVKIMRPGVAEATGDEKFDKMLKGVTSKKAVTKQQKTDTKQQARDAFGGMFGGGNPADKLGIRPKGVAEGSTGLSIQQLATISDEALDKAYGYGRSTPGNTFGWQANMMSASYAKKMIDSGITDIEAISDAIHKGWNVTAQKFVANPDQFSDTEKLRAAGKLDAKLQQRAQLMKQNYAQLPEEEKEKDRVVARALLKALSGSQGVAEGGVAKKPQPYNDTNWAKRLPKEKLDAIAGAKHKKDKKDKDVSEGYYDYSDYYDAHRAGEYGRPNLSWHGGGFTSGGGETEPVKSTEPLPVGRPKKPKGLTAQLPADPFGRVTGKIPKGRTGQKFSQGTPDEQAADQKYAVENKSERDDQPWVDPKLKRRMDYAFGHYAGYRDKPEAFFKWIMNSIDHSEETDQQHDERFDRIEQEIKQLSQRLNQINEQHGSAVANRFSQRLAERFELDRPTADPTRSMFVESRAAKRAAIREIFAQQG
jgi:hypothetical protein